MNKPKKIKNKGESGKRISTWLSLEVAEKFEETAMTRDRRKVSDMLRLLVEHYLEQATS